MKTTINVSFNVILLTLILTFTSTLAHALDNKLWVGAEWEATPTGGDGEQWTDANNWLPIGVPALTDAVQITNGTVYIPANGIAGSIQIGAAATLMLGSTNTVPIAIAAFASEGSSRSLTVAEDFVCAGQFAFGGRMVVDTNVTVTFIDNLAISIGGDLKMTNGAVGAIFAATTSGAIDFDSIYDAATIVTISGQLNIADSSVLYTESDRLTGTSVHLKTGSLYVGENASINSDNRGWDWFLSAGGIDARKTKVHGNYYTLSPDGRGDSWNISAQYGGGSRQYGNRYAPFLPGAPSGGMAYSMVNLAGGGNVWITSTETMEINGKVLARGTRNAYNANSGGSIWLIAKRLLSGSKATLIASGGTNSHGNADGGGSGGRISVALGITEQEAENLARGEDPEELDLISLNEIRMIATDASPGTGGKLDPVSGLPTLGEPGTTTTLYGSLAETTVDVRGNPLFAQSPSPDYKGHQYEKNTVQTFSAPLLGYDPTDSSNVRYDIAGYVVSNDLTEIASGTGNTVSFNVGVRPATVTWLWDNLQTRLQVDLPSHVDIKVDEIIYDETTSFWTSDNGSVLIEAIPDEGYEFLCWEGEVEYGKSASNPIVVTGLSPRAIKPFVRAIESPITRTWTGASNKTYAWNNTTYWNPKGIPGPNDDLIIPRGTCVVSNYLKVASITLSGNGSLRIANTASPRLEEAVLHVDNDISLSNTASLIVAPQNLTRHGVLTVGKNLTLRDTSSVRVSAGPLDDSQFTLANGAGFINVAEKIHLKDQSSLYPQSEYYTGGSVIIRAKAIEVDVGAQINAVGFGYRLVAGRDPMTLAPGAGFSYTTGGGYGGYGFAHDATYGNPYGFENSPVHPGSPRGSYNIGGNYGGGLIRIHAENIVLSGTLTASSADTTTSSGGGIWATASRKLVVSETAQLLAKGGTKVTGVGKEGGGGRIALGQKLSETQLASLAATGQVPENEGANKYDADKFLEKYPGVTIDVSPGDPWNAAEGYGTFTFLDATQGATLITIR